MLVRLAAGLALAAGQRSMHIGAAEYPHPRGVAFEVVGVDFLVDSALRPWLLEFNAVPSMARQVSLQSFLLLALLPLCAISVKIFVRSCCHDLVQVCSVAKGAIDLDLLAQCAKPKTLAQDAGATRGGCNWKQGF